MRNLLLMLKTRAVAVYAGLAGLFAWMPRPARRALLWGALVLPAALVVYTLALLPLTPSVSEIRKAKSEQPAQLMSVDGKLLAEYRWANREWVELPQISPHVLDALIATEDHRFYRHWGMDWRRTASSVVHTLGGSPQGGSTITQQLARNLFPDEIGRSRVFPQALTRKLKEAITAVKIEASYTKDEILETYLNTVPFLYNAYGIEMAARTYFDKSAGKLNVLESATLIGMLKGTAYYNPVLNPERALARRNTVLSQMVKHGKLEPEQFDRLKARPLGVNFERQTEVMGPASHFAMQLRKQLLDWADSRGYNLYADGLVIRTTIDSRLQAIANQAVARQGKQLQGVADAAWSQRNGWSPANELVQTLVRESAEYRAALDKGQTPDEALKALLDDAAFLQKLRTEKTRVQAGFLAQDPATGHVLAWVGSRDFAQDPFDHVQAARRQPGSTFKPFVYGAAFANGASPGDTLMDAAVEIPLGGGRVWRPTDGTPPSDQPMTLADGLALSKNTITAQVMQQVGPGRVAEVARALGVRQSPLEEVPSLALGTSPVTLKEMVTAYSSIVNLGRYVEPVFITRIEDRDGKVLETFAPSAPQEVFEPRAAQTLRNTMRGAIDRGTATAIRTRYGVQADVAGKTGTTQDNTDGWFILMHARVVAGAWAGFNDGRITLRSDHWGQGARSALPMVGEFVQQAFRSKAIDGNARFVDEFASAPLGMGEPPPPDAPLNNMRDWIRGLFRNDAPPAPPGPSTAPPWPIGPARPPVTTDPGYPSGPPVPAEERVGG
jgi:penicillin-binding protein 1A